MASSSLPLASVFSNVSVSSPLTGALTSISGYFSGNLGFGVGTSGQVLTTNGAGIATWATVASSNSGPSTSYTFTANETLSAGNLISIIPSGSSFMPSGYNMRIMQASMDSAKQLPAEGWVTTSITSGNTGTAYLGLGIITGLSNLTPGYSYFLSTIGGITTVIPSGTGQLLQIVGKALSTTELFFNPYEPIILG